MSNEPDSGAVFRAGLPGIKRRSTHSCCGRIFLHPLRVTRSAPLGPASVKFFLLSSKKTARFEAYCSGATWARKSKSWTSRSIRLAAGKATPLFFCETSSKMRHGRRRKKSFSKFANPMLPPSRSTRNSVFKFLAAARTITATLKKTLCCWPCDSGLVQKYRWFSLDSRLARSYRQPRRDPPQPIPAPGEVEVTALSGAVGAVTQSNRRKEEERMAALQRSPRDILLDTDADYQRLLEQHHKYDEELQRILKEPYLSSEDLLEEIKLKKLKLHCKDEMERIASRIQRARAQHA